MKEVIRTKYRKLMDVSPDGDGAMRIFIFVQDDDAWNDFHTMLIHIE